MTRYKTLMHKETGEYAGVDFTFSEIESRECPQLHDAETEIKDVSVWTCGEDLSSYELKTVVVMSEEEYNSLKGITFEDLNPELQKTLKNLPDPL